MPQEAAVRLELIGFPHPVTAVSATVEFFIICFKVSRLLSHLLQLGGKRSDRSLIGRWHRVGRATCELAGNVGIWDAAW